MAGAAAAMKTLQARRDMDIIKPVGHGGPVASSITFCSKAWRAASRQTGNQTMTFRFGPAERPGRLLMRRSAMLFFAAPLVACDEGAEVPLTTMSAPPPAVAVLSVQPTGAAPGFDFNGRVVAVEEVQLRARVTGFLDQQLFTEGSDIERGDLLFVIEQTQFEAEVARADAEVVRARALLAEAQATLGRTQEAARSSSVSEQKLDQATAAEPRARAELLAAEAKLEMAELNLSYTEIRAPVAGRIGRADFSVGSLVGPDSGVLATIVSQDPIYVTFPVSQRQLLAHRGERGDPVVRVTLPDGTPYEHPGKLNFLGIQVDPGTDTVTVRAEVPNPNRLLADGEFVGVRVERGEPEQVLSVPQAAVLLDQAGPYVLVVGRGDKVEARRVTLGDEAGTQVVIREGLQQGERVIVEGVQKVRPGMVVAGSEAAVMPAGQIPLEPRSGSTGPEPSIADDPFPMSERGSSTGASEGARAARASAARR
jgi:membrane fusion protein (multidrug efflux system)